MKKTLLAFFIGALMIPSFAMAVNVSWDYSGNILRPLQSLWNKEVQVSHITATSTTATSTFPNLHVTGALNLFGTIGTALSDFCTAITGGAGLCDGTDDGLTSVDISDNTNLAVSSPITLTGDTVGINQSLLSITESQISDLGDYIQVGTTSIDSITTLNNLLITESQISDLSHTVDTTLTEEQVEDFVGGMLGGTETLISVTYQDATNDIDFVVDNNLANYSNATSLFFDTAGDALSSTGSTINLDINGLTSRTGFSSGDELVIYEAGVGIRKIDYDDLPGAGGGITSLNGQTGSTQTFATSTSDNATLTVVSSGNTHTFTPGVAAGYNIPLTASTTNWETAFGWGDHAAAGYLETSDIGSTVQAYNPNLTAENSEQTITSQWDFTATTTHATSTFAYAVFQGAINIFSTTIASFADLWTALESSANTWFGTKDTDDLAQGATNLYNQTHTGDVTGSGALTIASGAVDPAMLANADFGDWTCSSGVCTLDTSYLTNINGESLEDLSDVAAMTQATGDLLYWTGSAWSNIATSSLGISGGGGSIDGSGAATRLALWQDSDTLTSDLGLFWSNGLTASSTGFSAGSELITNGTFTGSATGWTLQSGCSIYSSNQVTVLYDATCQGDSGNPSLTSASFTLTAGSIYTLSADITLNGDAPYCYISGSGNTPTGCNSQLVSGTNTFTFTAGTSGSQTITFESWNYNNDAGWSIDNVTLIEKTAASSFTVKAYSDISTFLIDGQTDDETVFSVNNSGGVVIGTSTPTTNLLSIWRNGGIAEAITATIGGWLGIGTSTPQAPLHVASSTAATSTIQIGVEGKPACMILRDSDDAGWTYGVALNGSVTWSTTSCE